MTPYLALALAISAEVIATSTLKSTDSFTRPLPSVLVVVAYAVAFYFLSVAVKVIPVGVAYGIWSGLGIVLVSVIAYFLHKQSLSVYQITGLMFIVLGVALVNFKS
ncbi:multidrug efflux SMR transporter [Limnohabitans sp. Bal53]|uniref:DMT family transporter n=1 Tax=Limnohabitans sp. Bal53 TaxID=1977910 RepID=UPI000D3CD4D2|nr:multidrug efflux SMR transporter [Limnohabitans sp. Bal53]PUE42642.1 QacE family quaternary ammonium compound efflux SMR transporter [Limnohabitans sp. Bal53]